MSAESVNLLMNAALEAVKEPENIPANRTGLLDSIAQVADRLTPEVALRAFEVLVPITRGEDEGLAIAPPMGDPDNPLSRFRIHLGKSTDVRGSALEFLARVEASAPGIFGQRLDPLLEAAVTDLNAAVRAHGFVAARHAPRLSEATVVGLALGTRDPDPGASAAAFWALAKRDLELTYGVWYLLAYSFAMARGVSYSGVRRAAAFALTHLRGRYPTEDLAGRMATVETAFLGDVCHSVREAMLTTNLA
jgi:hypothetical protein